MNTLHAAGIVLALHFALASLAGAEQALPLHIRVDSPEQGATVRNDVHQAPIRGRALLSQRPADFDVMIVLDISGSTVHPAGVDVDGDGQIGVALPVDPPVPGAPAQTPKSTDPGDSILAAEVAAADRFVGSLEQGGRVRVGVVSFSGDMNPDTGRRRRYDQQDAWLEVPLSADFAAVQARLPAILARGPYGGTNFAAGLRLAITELAGLQGARSPSRPGARKVVLFLTDGVPTFPVAEGSVSDPGDIEAALTAARLARQAGITVHSYGIGPSALDNPRAASEIARITQGTFLPVRKPGDIVSFLQATSFADVEDVSFTNLTTREISYDVDLAADGSFSGFVPVRAGSNRVRITALASDSTSSSVEFDLRFERSGASERELAVELERIRERNKELVLRAEREPIRRFREQQRKQLLFEPAEAQEEGDR